MKTFVAHVWIVLVCSMLVGFFGYAAWTDPFLRKLLFGIVGTIVIALFTGWSIATVLDSYYRKKYDL